MLDHKDEEKQALERYLDKHNKRKKWLSLSAESEEIVIRVFLFI